MGQDLSANVTWTLPVEGIDLKARFSVFNVLNSQTVVNVHSRYESTAGNQDAVFRRGHGLAVAALHELVVTWNF